jgi:hypothetical protein
MAAYNQARFWMVINFFMTLLLYQLDNSGRILAFRK